MATRQEPKHRRWRPRDIEDGLYTTAEVAHYTNRATQTVGDWCADGKLVGAIRDASGRWKIPAELVRRILRDGSPPWGPATPSVGRNGAAVQEFAPPPAAGSLGTESAWTPEGDTATAGAARS